MLLGLRAVDGAQIRVHMRMDLQGRRHTVGSPRSPANRHRSHGRSGLVPWHIGVGGEDGAYATGGGGRLNRDSASFVTRRE